MSLFDNPPKIGWTTAAAKGLTADHAQVFLEELEAEIEANDCVKGTQVCVKRGRIEGAAERSYQRHDVLPVAVAVRVDHERSYVYNIKNQTRTATVPIETALAFVRLMNRDRDDQPRAS